MLEVAHTLATACSIGDATRVNLLRMAGAEHARILVVAVDARSSRFKIVNWRRTLSPVAS